MAHMDLVEKKVLELPFLRKDGTVWTTDKYGFIMDLLAAEIIAKT